MNCGTEIETESREMLKSAALVVSRERKLAGCTILG